VAKKILYADDEMAMLLLISETLKEEGFEVLTASNGKEALYILDNEKNIELVILDIKMPEMDGIAALHIIKELHPDLPVILYTAYGDLYKQDFATWASDDYITKSADLGDLLASVKRHLKD
jgi:two-component system response regulator (stage 0 sporulation protein F)